MSFNRDNFAACPSAKEATVPFFNLEELLNRGFYIDSMQNRELGEVTQNVVHHLELLVDRIRKLNGAQLSRGANPHWNDRRHYDKAMAESPVDYIVHDRLPSFTIDGVLYRFDIIQTSDGIALRVVQDELGTIKERKKKYFERYEGLVAEDQEKETTDLLRELLGNLRKDLQSDIIAALDKATSPEKETASQRQAEKPSNGPQQQKELKIPSFYDSIIFMGMLSQRCVCRLHPQLGLLIML